MVQGRYVRVWRHWLELLVENSQSAKEMPITIMRILTYNRSYPLCPVPGYDVGKVQKLESLELYDYLTLFQYPWPGMNLRVWHLLHYLYRIMNALDLECSEEGSRKMEKNWKMELYYLVIHTFLQTFSSGTKLYWKEEIFYSRRLFNFILNIFRKLFFSLKLLIKRENTELKKHMSENELESYLTLFSAGPFASNISNNFIELVSWVKCSSTDFRFRICKLYYFV